LYHETTEYFSELAITKVNYLKENFLGFFVGTMMAGAYVSVGMMLTLTIGNSMESASNMLVMGALFGIALTLIVFAGAELFSGHTMFMAFGYLHKKVSALSVVGDWMVCWSGNLVGAVLLSTLFVMGGSDWIYDPLSYVHNIADIKVNSSIIELVSRGSICNWLICLAIWMTRRSDNDVAKCIFIFWCLFAFVSAGFEHGVANMTVFTLSLLGAHTESVTVWSVWYNLFWVSIGNVIGGAGFISLAYYLASYKINSLHK
jgi:nitrite transporter NirC